MPSRYKVPNVAFFVVFIHSLYEMTLVGIVFFPIHVVKAFLYFPSDIKSASNPHIHFVQKLTSTLAWDANTDP